MSNTVFIQKKAHTAVKELEKLYPEAICSLNHGGDPYKLLVMAVLSAQCTDARVNMVSLPLFEKYPTPDLLAASPEGELEEYIRSVGLYNSKAKNLRLACRTLVEEFGGKVPSDMDALLKLGGVGRKVANLIRGDLYGLGGIVADTHCMRISTRLGLSPKKDPLITERALSGLIPIDKQSDFCHRLVLFGRDICTARNPKCPSCPLRGICNHAILEGCRAEEAVAHIKGWDFSHIDGRFVEISGLSWDYKAEVLKRLTPNMRLLDLDTGGGEVLLEFGHPYELTAVTESYPPNAELCRQTLSPLGIDVREADLKTGLPFPDESFDIVTDRHGDLNPKEIYRVLKKGGFFITQQVGADNDRELVELLMGNDSPRIPFPDQQLKVQSEAFERAGFEILDKDEAKRPLRFTEVSALCYFARIIEWEFTGFSVDKHSEGVIAAADLIRENGYVEGMAHRFFMVCRKPHHSTN